MKWFLRSVFSCAAACAALGFWTPPGRADSPSEPRLSRPKLVEETLRREAREAVADRSDLLRPALTPLRAYEPAYWQSGFVYDAKHKKWLEFSQAEAQAAGDARLKAYGKVRKEHPDTIQGNLDVARWCLGQKLEAQAGAHLTRVLELNPNQPEARQLLGYRLERGSWVNDQDLAEAQAKARKAASDLAKWKPKLEKLRAALQSAGKAQKAKRRAQLAAIRDPAAVGAIDAVFCARGGEDLRLGLSLLENLTSAESAATLARYAVFAPWDTVGKPAAQALRSQRRQDYVPLLLAGLQSPVYSRAEVYQARGSGQTFYRQIFYRDGEERDLAVVDVAATPSPGLANFGPGQQLPSYRQFALANMSNRPASMSGGNTLATGTGQSLPPSQSASMAAPASSLSTGLDDPGLRTIMRAMEREAGSTSQNSSATLLGRRLSAVLTEATGESKNTTAADWWRWWYDENDCLPPVRTYRVAFVPIFPNQWEPVPADQMPQGPEYDPPPPPSPSPSQSALGLPVRCECFAAGTPVWTETGPVAVEKVAMGDRVFACDPETGCLALKVVLRPTVRPPAQLLKIRLDSEEVCCTGGHCFWVSGSGWVMARELQVGMNVHTIRGTATVASIAAGKSERAYNLVVEGFHSYFAGKGQYLTHDNTIRRPTDRVVPGLAADK